MWEFHLTRCQPWGFTVLNTIFGKYRGVVFSIALFILLDASVLLLNFYISFQIADDAVAVNNAGRQRMLSQRMVKNIYDIQHARENPHELERAADELEKTTKLFDQTLTAFSQGGYIQGADQKQVQIHPVNSPIGRSALTKSEQLWAPFKQSIDTLLATIKQHQPMDKPLQNAIQTAQLSNLELLTLMNQLTVDLETTATAKATRLRWIQTAGITLAIINFIIILVHFIGQLRRNDKHLEAARKETSDILNTVNEGLFLLDRNFNISSQHSAKLESMFGGKSICDVTFAELLKDLVCKKDLDVAQRFINLLFRTDVRSNLIVDLNPLDQIEIHLSNDAGNFKTRYLSFDFRRVMEDNQVKGVLVTVNDITEKVVLEQELAKTRDRNEQQLAMLSSILHTDPSALKQFIEHAFATCKKVNSLLREQSKGRDALHGKLNEIYIEIHSLKGDASAHQLNHVTQLAEEFESSIEQLKRSPSLKGNDLLRLTVQLESLLRLIESLQSLAEKLVGYNQNADKVLINPTNKAKHQPWQHLHELTQQISHRHQKHAYLVMTGFAEIPLPAEIMSLINDLSVQFIRNAVVHGLELPNLRRTKKKPLTGRVDVRLSRLPNNQIELSVSDDGSGIDYELIRRKALASGRWSREELAGWNHKKLLMLIFEHGFSTANQTTEDAGKGVGMDVIAHRIRQYRGTIRVSNRPGKHCEFTVRLPLELPATHANAA